jgi:hypothetical protein
MWFFLAGVALAIVGAIAFAPKPQTQKPAGFEDIKAPIAEDGKEMPVLFGCKNMKGANVVWYGDLKTTPIKVKGGKK